MAIKRLLRLFYRRKIACVNPIRNSDKPLFIGTAESEAALRLGVPANPDLLPNSLRGEPLFFSMLPFLHLQKTNTKDNLWVYILLLLREKEVYGWELPQMIEKEYGFKPGKITPYRVLYRLEADGFVESKADQRRRVYKITKKGIGEIEKAKNFYQDLFNKFDAVK